MGDINSKFLESVQENNLEKVKILLEKKADVNYRNHNDLSAIKLACISNDITMVKLLIKYGADLTDILKIAIIRSSVEIIKLLLENKADTGNIMETAVNKRSSEVVKLLLESKADFSSKSVYSACERKSVEILQLLIEHKASVNMPGYRYDTKYPLICACDNRNIDMVKILVENKANVNVKDSYGNTPFSICYYSRFGIKLLSPTPEQAAREKEDEDRIKEIVKILAKNGACNPMYPVYKYWDDKKFVRELIEEGAILPSDCVLKAMEEEDEEMVRFLVEHGGKWPSLEVMLSFSSFLKYYLENTETNPNTLCDGEYMIISAVKRRIHETTRILLEANANITVVDSTGSSLLEIAGNNCDAKITSLLLSHGASFSMLTIKDFNQAVRKGDMKKIKECVNQGIKPDNNFLKYATESKNIKLIEMACNVASGKEIDFEEEENTANAPELEEEEQEEGVRTV